jgi:hypothetical protein
MLLGGWLLSDSVSRLAFHGDAQYGRLVAIAIAGSAANIAVQPLMQAVQFERKATLYVALTTVSTAISIGLSVLMVVGLRRGVAGWVEADLHSVQVHFLSVGQGIDLRFAAEPDPHHPLGLLCAQIASHSPAGVIGVGVGDDRSLDRLPRVDIEVSVRAIEPTIGVFQQGVLAGSHNERSSSSTV